MRVLLVEDEAMTALNLTAEFELRGHAVLGPAKELGHTLNLAHAERPDLALVDIDLNGSPIGLEIAATLTLLRVPVVFLTGYKTDALAHHHSAKGLIAKPVHSGRVVECAEALRRLLDGAPSEVPSDLELFDSPSSGGYISRNARPYVLLVAADESVRARMNRLLARSGCSVVNVPDCKSAQNELQAVSYPLVIIDRNLDGGDGFELVSDIRNIVGRDRTFIVILSATEPPADAPADLIADMNGSVSKRCSDEKILESLRHVLRIIRLRPK